jgi:sterol 14-demethylase
MIAMSFSNTTEVLNGLRTAWTEQFQSHGALLVITIAVAIFFKSNLGGILATWPFFTRRHDFIKSNFEKTGRNMFSFNVLHVCLALVWPDSPPIYNYAQHSVTAVKGVGGRRAFFDDRSLSFTEGYKILMGAVSCFIGSFLHRFRQKKIFLAGAKVNRHTNPQRD